MPECRESQTCIGISTGMQLLQSGIRIPASGSVRYRWSRIIPALPTYGYFALGHIVTLCFEPWDLM
jgi:hypothetical protein